jgi:hypothetical protein
MKRFTLFFIFFNCLGVLIAQDTKEQWLLYKANQKKVDSIHKLMSGSFKQFLIADLDSVNNRIDTVLVFEVFNKNKTQKEQLFSGVNIKRRGTYTQSYREHNYLETLKGNTTVFNFESDSSLYIRLALVIYERGITQVKFHSFANNVLVLREMNSNRLHYFRKD